MSKRSGEIQSGEILPFTVAEQRGGILLKYVEEVHRACAISRLPGVSAVVEGIINIRGEIIPVIDLRTRFGLPRGQLALTDRFIVLQCSGRKVALHVEEVDTPTTVGSKSLVRSTDKHSGTLGVSGVAKLPDDLILIYDADAFLSSTEKAALERALAERQA